MVMLVTCLLVNIGAAGCAENLPDGRVQLRPGSLSLKLSLDSSVLNTQLYTQLRSQYTTSRGQGVATCWVSDYPGACSQDGQELHP